MRVVTPNMGGQRGLVFGADNGPTSLPRGGGVISQLFIGTSTAYHFVILIYTQYLFSLSRVTGANTVYRVIKAFLLGAFSRILCMSKSAD